MQRVKWDEWQRQVLEAEGNILLCTGRQVGKTTIFSVKAAERMVKQRGCRILVVSLTEDQAQLIIGMMLNHLEDKYSKLIDRSAKGKPTKNRIILRNGSQVLSRPVGNTGNSVRGFTGDVLIVDEASRMDEQVWTAIKPTLLTTGGDIWLCSTPFGKQGYFWESFNRPDEFKIFHISSEEVIKTRPVSLGWPEELREKRIKSLELEKASMSKLAYGQEYLGLFMEDVNQFFPDELIRKCMNVKRRENIQEGKQYYLGMDIARLGDDETTYEIIELKENGQVIHVEHQITTKQRLSQTTEHTLALDRLYDFKEILIDDEGIGVGVYDNLFDNEQTRRKIVPINNSKRVQDIYNKQKVKLLKEDLYNNLRRLMELGRINLLDDENVFQSFKSCIYEYTTDNYGRSYLKIYGNYTHIVEGLIRACWPARKKPLNSWIDSI